MDTDEPVNNGRSSRHFDKGILDEDDFDDADNADDIMQMNHIKTLKYLREILQENKELKTQIRLLIKQVKQSAEKPEEQIIKEDNFAKMVESIVDEEIHIETSDNETQTEIELNEFETKYYELSKQANIIRTEFENELKRIDAENDNLKRELHGFVKNKNQLNDQMNVLTTNLNETKHQNMELSQKVRNLLEENKQIKLLNCVNDELLEKIRKKDMILNDRQKLIDALNSKITQFETDLEKTNESYGQEIESLKFYVDQSFKYKQTIINLEENLQQYQLNYQQSEQQISVLNETIDKLKAEIDLLKKRLIDQESNKNFREFVNLKRELNALKNDEKNQIQNSKPTSTMSILSQDVSITKLSRNTSPGGGISPLPPLKESSMKKKK